MRYLIYSLFIFCAGCGNSISVMDLYTRGQQEFANKNLTAAEKTFSEVIRLDDDFLNAYLMLAKINYHNKDYDKTLGNLESILNKDPDHAGALYWKGRTLVISGKDEKDESVKILQSVLDIDSHHIPARLLLALVFEKNGNYKEALHEYITAMNEEETLISARGNLAVLYRRLGLKERASQEIDRAVKISEITGREMKSLNLIKSEFDKWEEK
ncbi:MAG TPA: tetratricopeptide repeat protein [Spirochaetota bacterium]|nr:tetratricopeptide repeat protein [Spirochaetota bacterium]HPS86381.1 tetratricopeptide repeat protein [Spirochaetota bacterium]